jgi:hypothetical protein
MLYESRAIGLYAGSDIMTSANKRTRQSNYKSEKQRPVEPPLQRMLGEDIAKVNRSFQDRPRINFPVIQRGIMTSRAIRLMLYAARDVELIKLTCYAQNLSSSSWM